MDAAEINQVVEWLAGLVREHALPQKLLIIHQFRYSMITNREAIETPPELDCPSSTWTGKAPYRPNTTPGTP